MVDAVFQPFSVQTNAFQTGPVETVLTASASTYTLTGKVANLVVSDKINASAGSYSVTGNSTALFKSIVMPATAGSYALSGQPVIFIIGKTMSASAATYTLTGQTANLKQTHIEPFAPGFYPVTGQTARLSKTYTLTTGYTGGDRVFQANAFQDDLVQIVANQNDVTILGKSAYFTYLKSGTRVYLVI